MTRASAARSMGRAGGRGRDPVNPILALAAIVVVGAAVVAVSAREARIVVLALAVVLLVSPVVADPLAAPVGLAARLVGGHPGRLPAVDRGPRRPDGPAGPRPDRRLAHRLAGRVPGGRRGQRGRA